MADRFSMGISGPLAWVVRALSVAFSATDLESLNGELVDVVRETVQPEQVSVWLREPGGRR